MACSLVLSYWRLEHTVNPFQHFRFAAVCKILYRDVFVWLSSCCMCSPTNVQNADELLVARTPYDSRLYGRGMSGPGLSSPTSGSSIVSFLPAACIYLLAGFTRLQMHILLTRVLCLCSVIWASELLNSLRYFVWIKMYSCSYHANSFETMPSGMTVACVSLNLSWWWWYHVSLLRQLSRPTSWADIEGCQGFKALSSWWHAVQCKWH